MALFHIRRTVSYRLKKNISEWHRQSFGQRPSQRGHNRSWTLASPIGWIRHLCSTACLSIINNIFLRTLEVALYLFGVTSNFWSNQQMFRRSFEPALRYYSSRRSAPTRGGSRNVVNEIMYENVVCYRKQQKTRWIFYNFCMKCCQSNILDTLLLPWVHHLM